MDAYRAMLYEMRPAFAAGRPQSFAIISGMTDGGLTLEEMVRGWVNAACRRWYAEQ